MTIEEYFSTGPPHERPIFDEVMRRLKKAKVGPIHVEPVSVGIFLKRARTFAELRPMTKWVALSFSLRRAERHALMTRKVTLWSGRYWHFVNLREPEDIDDQIMGWLAEAYADSPE
jgi:hypothetical protein